VADRMGLRRAVGLPVFRGGVMAGVFTVYAPGEARFSDRDVSQLWRTAQDMMTSGPTLVPLPDRPLAWVDDEPMVFLREDAS